MKKASSGNLGVKLHQLLSFSKYFNKVRYSGIKPEVIFMPGCSLTGYSPKAVKKAFGYIKQNNNAGIYTGCCGKPSKLAGENELYYKYSDMMRKTLSNFDCPVVVCCQSCYDVLKTQGIKAVFLWEYMSAKGIQTEEKSPRKNITLKLPCGTSKETENFIVKLTEAGGCNIIDINRKCCRSATLNLSSNTIISGSIISCCGECRNVIAGNNRNSYHLLDIIFGEPETNIGKRNFFNIWKNRISLAFWAKITL